MDIPISITGKGDEIGASVETSIMARRRTSEFCDCHTLKRWTTFEVSAWMKMLASFWGLFDEVFHDGEGRYFIGRSQLVNGDKGLHKPYVRRPLLRGLCV